MHELILESYDENSSVKSTLKTDVVSITVDPLFNADACTIDAS